MLELKGNVLHFSFPEVHPEAKLTISFERTCRIPDDGKEYPLPGSLGHFPLRHVDDYAKRVPSEWQARGGVMLPMYQSEALWVRFLTNSVRTNGNTPYPFAVKVSAGKMSAVTGKPWEKKLRKDDYLVVPPQPWLDGFVVEEGKIRQFVAMPLGLGATVEEQLTGEAEWGGIQIEVFPMKREVFERRFPPPPPKPRADSRFLRSRGSFSKGKIYPESQTFGSMNYSCDNITLCNDSYQADMGLGAGGTMTQQIFKDPYDKDDWQKKLDGRRCYVHLANSLAWEAITKEKPPTVPPTAKDYKRMGLPWFDLYEDRPALEAQAALKNVKSVLQFGFQHGLPTLPENKSIKIKRVTVLKEPTPKKQTVRDGEAWAEE